MSAKFVWRIPGKLASVYCIPHAARNIFVITAGHSIRYVRDPLMGMLVHVKSYVGAYSVVVQPEPDVVHELLGHGT